MPEAFDGAMTVRETPEVAALYDGVQRVLDIECDNGQRVGDCTRGVYLFYDYDEEPIYVGQTTEKIRTRIRRHLTNQRTDAVAMSVLDPFEVAEIEMWPFWDLVNKTADAVKDELNRAEYTVYQLAIERSQFDAILNENKISETDTIPLPPPVRGKLLAAQERRKRKHPDIRLARRARTISNLARVISERKVRIGIRRTLLAQAERLQTLARERLAALDE